MDIGKNWCTFLSLVVGGCLLQNFSDLTAKPEVSVITDICANAKGYEALAIMKQRMRG